jgi:hypothetical protein
MCLWRSHDFPGTDRSVCPQPSDVAPGPWCDVQVHGAIDPDGRVQQVTVLPAGRPDAVVFIFRKIL